MNAEDSLQDSAAFWFARSRSDRQSRGDRARFLRWLNADPAHAAAYAQYESLWQGVGAAAAEPEIVELRREALAHAPKRRSGPWRWAGGIAAVLALFLLGTLALLRVDAPPGGGMPPTLVAESEAPASLRTAVGERSVVTLQDGSVVELNTDSLVLVDYETGRRNLKLVRGQALFQVARDASRPFTVEAAGRQIVALGTEFDVRVDEKGMKVTLIEGKVAVKPVSSAASGGAGDVRNLRPGEQLIARADRPVVVLPADVRQAVSWRTGRIIFSDEPLGEVVEEINRYSTRKVVLADSSLADLRVSGVFRVGSTAGFVSALDTAFPVTVEGRQDRLLIRWERGSEGRS